MLNRGIRTYEMVDEEPPKWMTDAKADKNRDPRDLTEDQTRELILLDMEQRPQKNAEGVGSSQLMADLSVGNWDAGKQLYYEHHHTNPDEATAERAESFFDRFSPAVTNVIEESGREPAKSALARQAEQEYATPDLTTPINAGMLSEITDLPTRRGGGEILGEVASPQRGGRFPEVSVPQRSGRIPEVRPTQRGQIPIPQPRQPAPAPKPQLEPVSVEARRRSGAEILREQQAQSSRIDPTLPPLPELEEIVPTQRGQVPIPEMAPEEKPVPPVFDLIDLTTLPKAVDQSYERAEEPVQIEDRRAEIRASIPKAPTKAELRERIRSAIPATTGVSQDPDTRTGSERRFDRARDTFLTGATLGAYDEVSGFLNQAFADTPYDETVSQIRKNVAENRLMNPTAAFFQETIPGLVTGGGLAGQLVKRGLSSTAALGGEGAFTGAMYGETPAERAGQAVLFGAGGATIGGVLGWMTSPSRRAGSPSAQGGRTQTDEQIDDGILAQSIEPGGSVFYKTNNGGLAKAQVLSVDKNAGTVKVKSGDTQASVKVSEVEKIEVRTDKQIADYERLQDFDNARGQYKPRRQVVDYEETVKQGRTKDDPIMRDATWRDATNAGELWDGMKDGVKKWYDQKLTGADDMLTRRVSKAVGARFARASQNAVRWSTNAFVKVGEPLRNVAQLADDDRYFKAMIMDFTNAKKLQALGKKPPTQEEVEAYIRKNLGEDDVAAFSEYMKWNRKKKADHVDKLNGKQIFKENDHIHTQLNKQGKEKLFGRGKKKVDEDDALSDLKREEEFALRDDDALEYRTRMSMRELLNDTRPEVLNVDDYMNPFFSDFRRTSNLEALYQLAKVFGLDTADESFQPSQVFDRIEQSLLSRGIDPKSAKLAADTMKDDFVGGSKTPNNWLQALNSVGYMGSLAGPKSAILNLHDILVANAVYGGKSMRSMFDDMGYSVSEKGIRQNVGEFRNDMIANLRTGEYESGAIARDITRKGTDALMKASTFTWMDRIGKKGVTKMVIQDAVDNVDNLADRWGFYFSKRELDLIEKQIRKHGTNVGSMTGKGAELFEELFFAGLGQQQLISSSGRPAAWSRNPNARFMWALRGFAIKQQALLLREITDKIAEGKTKEAAAFMGRYAAFAAGGFGLVNESRQWLMGDGEFTFHGMLMGAGDQVVSVMSINTIGLNDYQWGRMMRNGVILTFLESVVPIGVDIPKDMVMDTVDALDGKIKGDEGFTAGQRIAYPAAQLPIIKQPVRLLSNLQDNVGLPNPMRQFTDMYIETELPKDGG
jgi:hypothetical protein